MKGLQSRKAKESYSWGSASNSYNQPALFKFHYGPFNYNGQFLQKCDLSADYIGGKNGFICKTELHQIVHHGTFGYYLLIFVMFAELNLRGAVCLGDFIKRKNPCFFNVRV